MTHPPISPATAEMSALLQQLLLAQGGRYASAVDERDWKQTSVVMQLPEGADPGRRLPAGTWLLLPWDLGQASHLEAWLDQLKGAGLRPDHLVLLTAMAHVAEPYLAGLGQRMNTKIVAVQTETGGLVGDPELCRRLAVLFERQTVDALSWVNPLEHLSALGDPRDPAVFSERLRRAVPRVWLTWSLIAANVLIYLVMAAEVGFEDFGMDQFIRYGANFAALTVGDDQWWRLLSCTFVHGGLLHLGFNMYALKVLGEMAERLFGGPMFAVTYLLAGLGGSVASLGWTLAASPHTFSVGASGAVFGIMGALLGFALARRSSVPAHVFKGLTRSALLFIGINVAIGLSLSFVDNAAHLGGLAVGIPLGALLSRDLPPAPQPAPARQALAIAVSALVLVAAYGLAASMIDEEAVAIGVRYLKGL